MTATFDIFGLGNTILALREPTKYRSAPPWWELSGDASEDVAVFFGWNPSNRVSFTSFSPYLEYAGEYASGGKLTDRNSDLHRYNWTRQNYPDKLKDLDPSQLDQALALNDSVERVFEVLTLMAESGVPPVIQALSQVPRKNLLTFFHSSEMEELRDKPWEYLTIGRRERGLNYSNIHYLVWEAQRHKMVHSHVVPGITTEDDAEQAEGQILSWISRLRDVREAVGGRDADKFPVPSLSPWKTTCGGWYGWDLCNHGVLKSFSHTYPSRPHHVQVPGLEDTYGDIEASLRIIEQHLGI